MVAAIIGLIGVVGFIGLALWRQDVWLGAIALFMLMSCWGGLKQAQALSRFAKLPRRDGLACPNCETAPPVGEFWRCGKCGQQFDTFQTEAVCPRCGERFSQTKCLDCGALNPMNTWMAGSLVTSK
jgi:DNA-directed RNA polymerase subunit RPC12/RpoP